jgi:hypothetical protein
MTVIDGASEVSSGLEAVSWEVEAGTARIVVRGAFCETTAAAARELLLDVCTPDLAGLVLAIEATVDPAEYDDLCHLVDVAQRRCWAASCRLEVTATDPGACDALAAAGWGAVTRR